ncbi:kappaPI-actitoxin-Ael3a-like isoform X1 [Leptotrombidium deliense]|uniref:KappaPI-actitoxin-Ael3a-like isoform X1 n=1 Tax=Leptotrombidium deliense TaxID=299467 RepID=A0A443SW10_9ACAR|nr:kappaPI-actitoxin-Ael3a-like isoform X1 [Leptotrombidium deliense]
MKCLIVLLVCFVAIIYSIPHSHNHEHNSSDSHPAKCHMEKMVKNCTESPMQFYYDKATHICMKYATGECADNENTFESKAICESTCGHGHSH